MSPKTSIITTYLLALLASLISAQTVREHLDRFCPSQNGQEVQLEERLFVTYHCGKAPEDWDLLESYPAAMDPEACSRACVASSPCKGSLYSAQPANRRAPCFLYLGATEPVLEDMDRVLWMSYRKVSPFWTRLIVRRSLSWWGSWRIRSVFAEGDGAVEKGLGSLPGLLWW